MWFNPFPAFLKGLKQDCECTWIVTTHAFSKFLSKWQMATIYFHFNLVLPTPAWEFLQSTGNISFTNVTWLVTFFCIHFDVSTAYIYKTYVQWWTQLSFQSVIEFHILFIPPNDYLFVTRMLSSVVVSYYLYWSSILTESTCMYIKTKMSS